MNDVEEAVSIRRHTADDTERLDYAALRREVLDHVRDLAGRTWTDYNLHDPGITLLEALCFALTEIVYRSSAEVPDLLRNEDGILDLERRGLMPAASILPSRPSTLEDYRALLLDKVPNLADARFSADRRGLLHLSLRLRSSATTQPEAPAHWAIQPPQADPRQQAREEYRRHRTLGEDLHDVIAIISEHPCTLAGVIEIEGSRDPAAILAEVYQRCASYISSPVLLRRIDERLAAGEPPDAVYVGPSTRVQPTTGLAAAGTLPTHLHVSDLAIQLRGVEGVRRVNDLWLDEVGKAPGRRMLRWRGPNWVLALEPRPDKALGGVQLRRRGGAVAVDPNALCEEYAELEARGRTPEASAGASSLPREQAPIPWPKDHFSVRHHLPSTYGLGDQGGSLAGVDSTRRAQIAHLGTYLALFDQVLAHLGEQWRHVHDLYATDVVADRAEEAAPAPTHWWQMLTDKITPGIDALYTKDVGTLRHDIYEARDARVARRHRVLDQMLALYGQTMSQNTSRQFLSQTLKDHAKVEYRLLADKAAFLLLTLRQGADRAGGFDHGNESNRSANGSGLERVLPLLLSFGPEERCHVVEHVLLRPRSGAPAVPASQAQPPTADVQRPLAQRVSVIFPKGTLLTSQPSFEDFANETVQLNLPAHVLGQCLWLDGGAMEVFEKAHAAWRQRLCEYANGPTPERAVPLNEASRALKEVLDRHTSTGG